MINRRFELWSKLDGGVPPAFRSSPGHEGDGEFHDLAAVLHGDISRARHHDIYLVRSAFIFLAENAYSLASLFVVVA
jgi:hypothetical protein